MPILTLWDDCHISNVKMSVHFVGHQESLLPPSVVGVVPACDLEEVSVRARYQNLPSFFHLTGGVAAHIRKRPGAEPVNLDDSFLFHRFEKSHDSASHVCVSWNLHAFSGGKKMQTRLLL